MDQRQAWLDATRGVPNELLKDIANAWELRDFIISQHPEVFDAYVNFVRVRQRIVRSTQ